MNNNFSNKLRKLKSSSGFTIMEVMLAITVLSVGIMGALTLITYNISIASDSSNKVMAASLAEEGIELVRNVRDTNWRQMILWDEGIGGGGTEKFLRFFCGDASYDNVTPTGGSNENARLDTCGENCRVYAYTMGSDKCYGDNFGASHGGYTGTGVNFYRLIHITKLTADSNELAVTIKWSYRGQNHYFTAKETLYNWK